MKRSTPELLVEKLHLGELAPAQAMAVRARLERDGELHRLAALAESAPEAMPEVLARRLANARAKAHTARRERARAWAFAVTVASLAVMALIVASPPAIAPTAPETRLKGGGQALVIYRRTGAGFEPLGDDAPARRGDVLQIAVRPGGARQAAVYSIDGRGLITEHQPPKTVVGSAEVRLESAFELDDAPHFERFVLILGDRLDAARIRSALAIVAAGEPATDPLVIDGARVYSRVVRKTEAH